MVRARVSSGSSVWEAPFALDTGASRTFISVRLAESLGLEHKHASKRARITTVSGIENPAILAVQSVEALGLRRENLEVLCHPLPAESMIDGLLGMDFFDGCRLTINFREHSITVD